MSSLSLAPNADTGVSHYYSGKIATDTNGQSKSSDFLKFTRSPSGLGVGAEEKFSLFSPLLTPKQLPIGLLEPFHP